MGWLFVLETISKSSPVVDNQQAKGPAHVKYDTDTGAAREVPSMLYYEMYQMPQPIVLY